MTFTEVDYTLLYLVLICLMFLLLSAMSRTADEPMEKWDTEIWQAVIVGSILWPISLIIIV